MTHTFKLRTPVHVALFTSCLLPHMIAQGGRWTASTPTDHDKDWIDIKVSVGAADDLGTNFVPKKQNYNYNDLSHYADAEENTKVMLTVCSAAAEREVSKKELLQITEDIKFTLKLRNKEYVPASAVPPTTSTAPAAASTSTDQDNIPPASADDDKTVEELAAEQAAAETAAQTEQTETAPETEAKPGRKSKENKAA